MNDAELFRYSRHILLPQVDVAGQEAIIASRVLIVGLGGLGGPVAMYLAAAGMGELVLVDDDLVDQSNLQRQIAHGEANVGDNKVLSAARAVHGLNRQVKVESVRERLDDRVLSEHIADADVVVDCSDNRATRRQLNRLCFKSGTPLVYGSAVRFEGQLAVFDFREPSHTPCYHCIYGEADGEADTCAQSGVFGPLVGVIGSMQALEALKLAAGIAPEFVGKLGIFDGLKSRWRYLQVPKLADCPVCGVP